MTRKFVMDGMKSLPKAQKAGNAKWRRQMLMALLWAGLTVDDAGALVGYSPATARLYARTFPECRAMDRKIRERLTDLAAHGYLARLFDGNAEPVDLGQAMREALTPDRIVEQGRQVAQHEAGQASAGQDVCCHCGQPLPPADTATDTAGPGDTD